MYLTLWATGSVTVFKGWVECRVAGRRSLCKPAIHCTQVLYELSIVPVGVRSELLTVNATIFAIQPVKVFVLGIVIIIVQITQIVTQAVSFVLWLKRR